MPVFKLVAWQKFAFEIYEVFIVHLRFLYSIWILILWPVHGAVIISAAEIVSK